MKAWLVRRGVAEERIRIVAHGEDRPLVETADDIANPHNRNVHVMIARYCRYPPGFPEPAGWQPPPGC